MIARKRFLINKKYLKNIVIVTVVVFSICTCSFFSFKYIDRAIAEKAQVQIEERLNNLNSENSKQYLEKMMLKNKIAFSKSYIENISLDNNITLLEEKGFHKEVIDSTNHSNPISEIFTKKNITIIDSYKAILSIPSQNIIYEIDEDTGNIHISYNKEDIDILSVEITGSTFGFSGIFLLSSMELSTSCMVSPCSFDTLTRVSRMPL